MISYLSGKIIDKGNRCLTLEVQGVGYKVFIPSSMLDTASSDSALALYIYTAVREDDISLYGFSTKEALRFFELLISVNRVGPKIALDIMEAPLNKVKFAIAKKDLNFLSRIPGIGKKTAERIILELSDKIQTETLSEDLTNETPDSSVSSDILEALMKLGYQRQHIVNVLKDRPADMQDEKTIIKYFLQRV